ncbi:MAG: hypothetical protein ACTHJQ_09650 [Rhizobiaceae bacterium]
MESINSFAIHENIGPVMPFEKARNYHRYEWASPTKGMDEKM